MGVDSRASGPKAGVKPVTEALRGGRGRRGRAHSGVSCPAIMSSRPAAVWTARSGMLGEGSSGA